MGDMLPQVSADLLPLLFAILLASQQDRDEQEQGNSHSDPSAKLFTVKSVSDKGLGAFASRDIARGEVIITERPLFIWPTKLDAATAHELVAQLTPSAKNAFFGLANAADPTSQLDPILAIRATTAASWDDPSWHPPSTQRHHYPPHNRFLHLPS